MIRLPLRARLFFILLLIPLAGTPGRVAAAPAPRAGHAAAARPLAFEPNAGQVAPDVRFLTHSAGGAVFFSPDAVLLAQGAAAVRLRWAGAQLASLHAGAPLPGRVNYLRGNDPAHWQTNLPTYAGLTYAQLYPGIDLAWDGTDGRLKGTYRLAPGADPAAIRWRYDVPSAAPRDSGVRVSVDAQGNLQIALADSSLSTQHSALSTEQAPLAWQERAGQRMAVPVRYTLAADSSIGFALGAYDRALPLIIDPTLVYATYLGGSGTEGATGIAVDAAHNIYFAGYTTSSFTFPPMNSLLVQGKGYWDAFVTKMAPDGQTLLFSTYLSGKDWDSAQGVAVDKAGNIFVAGETASQDFPLLHPLQPDYGGGPYDGFIAEFSAAGALLYSTYLGGEDADRLRGLALDGAGNIIVAGYTASHKFPLQQAAQGNYGGGFYDGFVSKLNPAGSALIYSTYLGGSDQEYTLDLAADAAGNAYVTGWTHSTDFPVHNALQAQYGGGTQDAFVTRLDPAGAIGYSTFLGGGLADAGQGIAVDGTGSAFVTGKTSSSNFPTANAYQGSAKNPVSTAFVSRLRPDGSGLAYSTFLGGSGSGAGDEGLAITVDPAGTAYVAGQTDSTDFPLQTPLQPAYGGGASDAFVVRLPAAGAPVQYATYLGGQGADMVYALATDGAGKLYLGGETTSFDFPLARPFQQDRLGASDILVAELDDTPATTLTPRPIHSPGPVPTYMLANPDEDDSGAGDTSSEAGDTPGPGKPSPGATPRATGTAAVLVPLTPGPAPPADSGAGSVVWIVLGLVAVAGIVGTVIALRPLRSGG